jgi:hypothetical protein
MLTPRRGIRPPWPIGWYAPVSFQPDGKYTWRFERLAVQNSIEYDICGACMQTVAAYVPLSLFWLSRLHRSVTMKDFTIAVIPVQQ